MEIRNKKKTLNPLMKNKKWRLSKKKQFLITLTRVYVMHILTEVSRYFKVFRTPQTDCSATFRLKSSLP